MLHSKTRNVLLAATTTIFGSTLVTAPSARATLINALWNGGNAAWESGANWSSNPNFPNNNLIDTYTATLNSGVATVNQDTHVDALTINNGARVVMAPGRDKSFRTTTLSIDSPNGAKFDLNDNCMIVDLSSTTAINSLLYTGFDQGNWTGGGIISSAALANGLTAVGYARAGDLGITNFACEDVGPNAMLLTWTYFGDANLDGTVDALDRARLQNGFDNGLTGWVNGDFNYDGAVDATDYNIWDFTFVTQGAPIPPCCVPEPTSALSAFALAGGALMRRRARRNKSESSLR